MHPDRTKRWAVPRRLMIPMAVAGLALVLAACEAIGIAGDPDPAEEWPAADIEHVVPLPAGGGTDTVTQLLNGPLEEELGVSVSVNVRDGGAGATGINYMNDQEPDGHTIMTTPNDLMTTGPVGNPDVAYDPETDVEPLALATMDPWVMLASVDSGIDDVDDFLDRAEDGDLTIGVSTVMGSDHYAWLLVERALDFPGFTYVTYGGGGPYMEAVYGGEVDAVLHVEPSIDEELVTPIFIMDPEPMEAYPEVPTTDELGWEDTHAALWQGIVVHPDTPEDLLDVMEEAIIDTVEGDAFQQAAGDADFNAQAMGREEFADMMETERQFAEELVDAIDEAEIEDEQ